VSGADLGQAMAGADGAPTTLGEALLAPTRIYVRPVLDLLAAGGIDGLAHITGGGLTENIVRVLPDGLGLRIDTSAWPRPDVFAWLQREGNIAEAEMLRTFNCGIGMVLLAPAERAQELAARSADNGIPCFDIGAVTTAAGDERVEYVA
jgi:phosphoribosylformylglycinamidine cyclo-ligase